MQIIVFINTRFEQFLTENNATNPSTIEKSNSTHSIVETLKNRMQRGLKVQDADAHWELIYQHFDLESSFSPAQYCAEQHKLNVPYTLMATPVRVQLGMRHSETHFLPTSQLPTKEQIDLLNEYFQGDYFLYQVNSHQYLLCSDKPMELSADRAHWSPDLSDFTLQMLTADSRLRKFHTDVQAWCHREGLAWNGLYLWGQGIGQGISHKL